MKSCKLISVIIPVYKVEKYLDRCVQSVVRQNYSNLEIILVDDGSPDLSGELCDRWAQSDSRIRVIHKENGGLSDARNVGTAAARGDYVTYIDSDDYVSPDYIHYLADLVEKNSADISCCGMVKTSKDTAIFSVDQSLSPVTVMTGYEACEGLLKKYYMKLVTAWGKLYKREIVLKYPFPKGRIFEDEATTGKFYYQAKKVAIGNRCLYGYYQNPEGITHTVQQSKTEDKIWALRERAMFFEQKNEKNLARNSWNLVIHFCIDESLDVPGKYDKFWMDDLNFQIITGRLLCKIAVYKISPGFYKFIKDNKPIIKEKLGLS